MVEPVSFGWLFVKTIFAMVIIIGLALFCIRYVLPRLTGYRVRGDSRIKVLDMRPLEARKAIYVVKIADKTLAVGVTEQGMSPLCELSSWPEDAGKKS